MHVITINITMCDIGHLHVYLLIYCKHGYPQGYMAYYKAIIINFFENFHNCDRITMEQKSSLRLNKV